ncbi:MAG: orotate phosphoribosyltransferase [Bacteroidota bacterium]
MENTAQEIANILLDIGAIQLRPTQPFQWSSGWHSPVYCDNRLTLSYPKARTFIKEALVSRTQTYFPEVEVIAGVATAGIPQAALVAETLTLPMVYVRTQPKSHGMENMIEGKVAARQKVVVVEDLISTGGSSLKAISALQAAGCEVLGLVAIMTYGFDVATNQFAQKNIPVYTLSNYTHVLMEAVKRNIVTEDMMASLHEWRKQPTTWTGI